MTPYDGVMRQRHRWAAHVVGALMAQKVRQRKSKIKPVLQVAMLSKASLAYTQLLKDFGYHLQK